MYNKLQWLQSPLPIKAQCAQRPAARPLYSIPIGEHLEISHPQEQIISQGAVHHPTVQWLTIYTSVFHSPDQCVTPAAVFFIFKTLMRICSKVCNNISFVIFTSLLKSMGKTHVYRRHWPRGQFPNLYCRSYFMQKISAACALYCIQHEKSAAFPAHAIYPKWNN